MSNAQQKAIDQLQISMKQCLQDDPTGRTIFELAIQEVFSPISKPTKSTLLPNYIPTQPVKPYVDERFSWIEDLVYGSFADRKQPPRSGNNTESVIKGKRGNWRNTTPKATNATDTRSQRNLRQPQGRINKRSIRRPASASSVEASNYAEMAAVAIMVEMANGPIDTNA